jgi:F0F1-type ATP synthase membrane subunit b/b'
MGMDWFAAVSAFAGIFFTVLVYHLAEKTKLDRLEDLNTKIHKEITDISRSQKFMDFNSLVEQLRRLEGRIEALGRSVADITSAIKSEATAQQSHLIDRLHEAHLAHIAKSRDILDSAVRAELERVSTGSRTVESALSTVSHLVEHSISNMGSHLEENYRSYIQSGLNTMEASIVAKMRGLLAEVSDVQHDISTLPMIRVQELGEKPRFASESSIQAAENTKNTKNA